MAKNRSLQSAKRPDDFSDVPTEDMVDAILTFTSVLSSRGIDLLDERTKRAIDARWEFVERAGHIHYEIAKILAFINGAALAGSGNNLKIALFSRTNIDGQDYDRIGELSGLYDQAVSDWRAMLPQIAPQFEAALGPVVRNYLNAMQKLKEGKDNGNELRELAKQESLVTSLDDLSRLMRPGRKPGAQPVTRFILGEVKRIKELHQCKSRGEIYEWLIAELEAHPEVKQWKARNKKELHLLTDQSVVVQAFESLMGGDKKLDRDIGAERLRDMERNHPNLYQDG